MTPLEVRPPRGELSDPVLLRVPASKSETLRALVAAALAGGGRVTGEGPWPGDVHVLARGLRALGVALEEGRGGFVVRSGPDRETAASVRLDAEDGGAPARFLLAVAATLRRPVTVTGGARLSARPMAPLLAALAALGAEVSGVPGLPATVRGPARGGDVAVDSGASSQFVSALLLAGPAFPDGVRLATRGAAVSRPYVDLTRATMEAFGVAVGPDLAVAAGAAYRPAAFAPGPDWSGATVCLAAAAFLGRAVLVPGLDPASRQPDARAADVLRALGLEVAADEAGVRASGRPARGGAFDAGGFPDSVPALAALAALAPEPVRLAGAAHLRVKECDRIEGLVAVLRAAGAGADALPDGLIVRGGFRGARDAACVPVSARRDHRLAMAAALLGLARPVRIDDAACVAKSFPGFFDRWPGAEVRP